LSYVLPIFLASPLREHHHHQRSTRGKEQAHLKEVQRFPLCDEREASESSPAKPNNLNFSNTMEYTAQTSAGENNREEMATRATATGFPPVPKKPMSGKHNAVRPIGRRLNAPVGAAFIFPSIEATTRS
jgi:hypothetical protein